MIVSVDMQATYVPIVVVPRLSQLLVLSQILALLLQQAPLELVPEIC